MKQSPEERELYAELARRFERGRLLMSIRAFNAAANQYTGGWQPQLALELAFDRDCAASGDCATGTALRGSSPRQLGRPRPRSRQASASDTTAEPAQAVVAEGYERVAASAPGEAAIYPLAKIQAGWIEILTQVHRYNRNIPPLLEHAHVRLIEGNRLILGVQTELFQQKIADPKRSKVIEQAVFDLHEVKLRLEVRVVDSGSEAVMADAAAPDDPLIAAGKALGGVVDE